MVDYKRKYFNLHHL